MYDSFRTVASEEYEVELGAGTSAGRAFAEGLHQMRMRCAGCARPYRCFPTSCATIEWRW